MPGLRHILRPRTSSSRKPARWQRLSVRTSTSSGCPCSGLTAPCGRFPGSIRGLTPSRKLGQAVQQSPPRGSPRNCRTWDRPCTRTSRTRSAPSSISSAAGGSEEIVPHQSSRNRSGTMDLDAFSSATRRLMAEHQVPGLSIAVTSSSRLVYAGAFGDADLAQHRATTTDTRFLWFSMSKIVTATAALRLADEGRLDLDAPVRSLVPSFAAKSGHTQPRIRQLLNHTAGAANPLPLRWVQPAGAPPGAARDKVGALLRRARPTRPVGELARYSNLGYLVLADVIATVAGEPFETYVRRAVLEPAGMRGTGYVHDPTADSATGYARLPRPLTPLARLALPPGIVGDRHGGQLALRPFTVVGAGYGGLIGDAPDAARLLRMHLADGIIDGQRILATDTARSMRVVRTPGKPFDLGLGWFRRPADRHARPAFVEHWGTGGGFWNAMRIYPALDLGVAVMANTTRSYQHDVLMRAAVAAFAR